MTSPTVTLTLTSPSTLRTVVRRLKGITHSRPFSFRLNVPHSSLVARMLTALLLIVLCSSGLHTANFAGVFLNADDFSRRELTDKVLCGTNNDEFSLGSLFHPHTVVLRSDSAVRRYAKSELFGCRSCEGTLIRFKADSWIEYELIDSGAVYVYRAVLFEASRDGKAMTNMVHYFFSNTSSSEIFPLTIRNVRQHTPSNLGLHDAIETQCTRDEDLWQTVGQDGHCRITFLCTTFARPSTTKQ